MKESGIVFIVGLLVLAGCSDSVKEPAAKPAPVAPAAAEHPVGVTQVIAYYFHGTVRCETCLRIERQAHELMNSRFAAELASGRLVFKPVNYDQPENTHFSQDYKLPCPSLVLVRQKDGKDQDWKLLGQTWDLVQIPPKLDQYIEEETSKVLQGTQ